MFSEAMIYEALRPHTAFDIVIGGAGLTANFDKGCIIINPLNSIPITRSDRNFRDLKFNQGKGYITQSSLIKSTYQLDFYKVNPANTQYIHAYIEAQRIQEMLKSMDVSEIFKANNVEILPSFGAINYLTEFNEQKRLVNRAFFDFEVIYQVEIVQEVKTFDKIIIDKNTIIGA